MGDIVPIRPKQASEEVCYCEHERKWHDACSKCPCPWFLSPDNKGALKRWKGDRLTRVMEKD